MNWLLGNWIKIDVFTINLIEKSLVLRHFRWKKELDLTLYMRTISLITSDICLKKLQM